MISPASWPDWVTFAGMLGCLTGFAAIGYRWMLGDEDREPAAAAARVRQPIRSEPPRAA